MGIARQFQQVTPFFKHAFIIAWTFNLIKVGPVELQCTHGSSSSKTHGTWALFGKYSCLLLMDLHHCCSPINIPLLFPKQFIQVLTSSISRREFFSFKQRPWAISAIALAPFGRQWLNTRRQDWSESTIESLALSEGWFKQRSWLTLRYTPFGSSEDIKNLPTWNQVSQSR